MKFNKKNFELPEQLDSCKAALKEFVQTELEPIAKEMNKTRQWSPALMPLAEPGGCELSLKNGEKSRFSNREDV